MHNGTTVNGRHVFVTEGDGGVISTAPAPTGMLNMRVPKSVQYQMDHGESTQTITMDVHAYNSMIIECKEMRTAMLHLQRLLLDTETINPLDGVAAALSPACTPSRETAPTNVISVPNIDCEKIVGTLLTENAQLRNEVQQLRQQLIEMNVNKMNVDNNNMKEIHA